jgi:hypothetical protein
MKKKVFWALHCNFQVYNDSYGQGFHRQAPAQEAPKRSNGSHREGNRAFPSNHLARH